MKPQSVEKGWKESLKRVEKKSVGDIVKSQVTLVFRREEKGLIREALLVYNDRGKEIYRHYDIFGVPEEEIFYYSRIGLLTRKTRQRWRLIPGGISFEDTFNGGCFGPRLFARLRPFPTVRKKILTLSVLDSTWEQHGWPEIRASESTREERTTTSKPSCWKWGYFFQWCPDQMGRQHQPRW